MITKLHVARGRLAAELYRRLREVLAEARGGYVTLRASMFTRDMSVMVRINRILSTLCKKYGCEKRRRGNAVRYTFPVWSLGQVTEAEIDTLARIAAIKGRRRRATVSVLVPESWLRRMDRLIEAGIYRDRSELVRDAISRLLIAARCGAGL